MLTVQSVVECEASCNATAACVALETEARSPMASSSASITAAEAAASLLQPQIEGTAGMLVGSLNCTLLRVAGPGAPDSSRTTYVRAPGVPIKYDWTGTYNAAPPVCPEQPNWVCKRYVNSWFPNATAGGGKIFSYKECGDYQGLARTNHSHDRVPYLANVIAGFDPRPWQEHSPSFAFPTEAEWEAVLLQVKAQCEDPSNRFGFPDASKPSGFQPAFNIYAWNEFGEGGIMAPTRGDGFMKVQTVAKIFRTPG